MKIGSAVNEVINHQRDKRCKKEEESDYRRLSSGEILQILLPLFADSTVTDIKTQVNKYYKLKFRKWQ